MPQEKSACFAFTTFQIQSLTCPVKGSQGVKAGKKILRTSQSRQYWGGGASGLGLAGTVTKSC